MSLDEAIQKALDQVVFTKEICYNVIGFVGITKPELEIISTPIFQRLRNIKQLGIAHYVFPGALQTRFNHSIGVLHYADQMVCSLQNNGFLIDEEKKENIREKVRMAALLHDIGHYPLSHIIEKAIIEDTKSKSPSDKLTISGSFSTNIQSEIFNHPTHILNVDLHPNRNQELDYAHHERMGNLVIEKTEIKQILKTYFEEEQINQIQRIISGIDPSAEKQIIHSELDADKFDYLTRDSHQTGVTYGIFDAQQIIRHLELSDKKELVVGVKSKRAVEHYLMSKYFLYSQVIHHKTVASFNFMAEKIYTGLLEREIAYSYIDLLEQFDDDCHPTYLTFDDNYFFNLMRDVDKGNIKLPDKSDFKINNEILTTYIKMVLNRQRLKLVDEKQKLYEKDETRKIKSYIDSLKNFDEYSSNLVKGLNESNMELSDKSNFKINDETITNFVENVLGQQRLKLMDEIRKLSENFETQTIKEFSNNEISSICAEAGIEPWWFIQDEIPVKPTKSNPSKNMINNSNYDGENDAIQLITTEFDDYGNENKIAKLLIEDESSIIKPLSSYQLNISRVYTKDENYATKLKTAIKKHRDEN